MIRASFFVLSCLFCVLISPWLIYQYNKGKKKGTMTNAELFFEISSEILKYSWDDFTVDIRDLSVFETAMSNRGFGAISLCDYRNRSVVISPEGIKSAYFSMGCIFGYSYCIRNIVRHENRHVQQQRVIPAGFISAYNKSTPAVRNIFEIDAELYGAGIELPLELIRAIFVLQMFTIPKILKG